jgi:pimeloyl-ACP methyl ester carboxylesterase
MQRTLLLMLTMLTACSDSPAKVVVDGIELHYVERGSGAPVVLIHGSLADYSYWNDSRQIEQLASQ